MKTEEKLKKRHEENLQRLKEFCLMDDDFMTACFTDNLEGVELILRIILNEPDLVVEDVQVQHFMKNLQKRSITLDVFATNNTGRKFNVEIQRADKGAGVKRARFHSSLIDGKVLEPGEYFEKLPETYVIFITENDIMGKGKPLYHINRYVEETGEIFDDKEHIVYVNGSYRGDNPLGRLMEDFHCTEPSKMYYNELRERVKYFKETKEGVVAMCRAMEEMVEKAMKESRLETAMNLIQKGKLTIEEIAECCELTLEEVRMLENEMATV